MRCSASQSRECEASDMGKHIQDPRAFGQGRGKGVVGTLVKEQAGFLPARQIRHIGRAVHQYRYRRIWGRAHQNPVDVIQPFQRPRASGGVLQDVGNSNDLSQNFRQNIQAAFKPRRIRLHNAGVAETVNYQPRKSVRLCMDQPIKRRIIKPVSHVQSLGNPRCKPRLVDHSLRIAV